MNNRAHGVSLRKGQLVHWLQTCKYVVKGAAKISGWGRLRRNGHLWSRYWVAIRKRDGAIEVVNLAAHADASDVFAGRVPYRGPYAQCGGGPVRWLLRGTLPDRRGRGQIHWLPRRHHVKSSEANDRDPYLRNCMNYGWMNREATYGFIDLWSSGKRPGPGGLEDDLSCEKAAVCEKQRSRSGARQHPGRDAAPLAKEVQGIEAIRGSQAPACQEGARLAMRALPQQTGTSNCGSTGRCTMLSAATGGAATGAMCEACGGGRHRPIRGRAQ